jgi:cardiolipin synthase
MRRAIENATQEVLLESYIFRDDLTGWEILELVSQASSRGVAVRVLADAFGSLWTRSGFWREMRGRGAEVRLFHPVSPISGTSSFETTARFWWSIEG